MDAMGGRASVVVVAVAEAVKPNRAAIYLCNSRSTGIGNNNPARPDQTRRPNRASPTVPAINSPVFRKLNHKQRLFIWDQQLVGELPKYGFIQLPATSHHNQPHILGQGYQSHAVRSFLPSTVNYIIVSSPLHMYFCMSGLYYCENSDIGWTYI